MFGKGGLDAAMPGLGGGMGGGSLPGLPGGGLGGLAGAGDLSKFLKK
jgi:signal recognition particle subunit SRP54